MSGSKKRSSKSSIQPPVDRDQRFSKEKPCPVCGGWQDGPSGQHCYGYTSEDAKLLYCTEKGSDDPTVVVPRHETAQAWMHRARGLCLCTQVHAEEGGCTLQALLDAKFPGCTAVQLKKWGVYECKYGPESAPAVFFPYPDESGDFANPWRVRIRVALGESRGGKKMLWKKEKAEKKPLKPYGLHLLEDARAAGYAILVEGETCALSGWLNEFYTIGLPGADTWREQWAEDYFQGFAKIFVVVEQDTEGKPDSGAVKIFKWLSKSAIRHRAHLVTCEGFKDLNDLFRDEPAKFKDRFKACLDAAKPWAEFEKRHSELARKVFYDKCGDLLQEKNLLERLAEDAHRRGLVREDRALKLVYLIRQSIEIADEETPGCSAAIKAQSAAGKNHVLKHALAFLPEEAIAASTLMSARNLFYTEGGRSEYSHRTLVLYEAAGMADNDLLAYVVRTLISEGRLKLQTVIDHQAVSLDKDGPTNFLTTTTRITLDTELETRLFSIPIDESEEQTRQILEAHSARWAGAKHQPVDLERWHALHGWLKLGNRRVLVPFASLGSAVPALALRMRRDWPGILTLVATHAYLHQAHRQVDEDGRIIADYDDYYTVHRLVDDLVAEAVDVKISEAVRRTVLAATALYNEQPKDAFNFRRGIQVEAIAAKLGIHKSNASRNVSKAINSGFLFNEELSEGKPAKIKPTSLQMPLDRSTILPTRIPVVENRHNRATYTKKCNETNYLGVAVDTATDGATGGIQAATAPPEPTAAVAPSAEQLRSRLREAPQPLTTGKDAPNGIGCAVAPKIGSENPYRGLMARTLAEDFRSPSGT